MPSLRYSFFLWCFFFSNFIAAQSNWRIKTVSLVQDTLVQDTLTIVSESVVFFDNVTKQSIGNQYFSIKNNFIFKKNKISFFEKNNQKIEIRYRVLPYLLSQTRQHLDSTQIVPRIIGNAIEYDYTPSEDKKSALLPEQKGLDYSGSFSRGVSVGNNQDLVLNSNFNLQLNGKLSNDIEVVGAISDNNIPIQPDGNTRQLQDFDKVFLQLKKGTSTLTAGDYELTRPASSYFMNYYKKLQGANFKTTFLNTNKKHPFLSGQGDASFAVALARGKFTRQTLVTQEANQGPYRLQGSAGERFIIVLAGTEKVYIDGNLMKRGTDDDYVVDYNQGAVTFTNRRVITKDSRVIVEFEYNDQAYIRSMYAFGTGWKSKKYELQFNIYSEQDSKGNSGQTALTPNERDTLALAGDKAATQLVSGVQLLEGGYNPDRIMYRLVDSLGEKILVRSNNPSEAKYTSRFTQVGFGLGSYRQLAKADANGRVYEWVGKGLGEYEPVVRLTPPKQKQLFTLGGKYALSKNTTVETEVALSHNDDNRFSLKDKADDTGIAAFLRIKNTKILDKKKLWTLESRASYERKQQNFEALNPYRPTEFTRDWNVGLKPVAADEHLLQGSIAVQRKNIGALRYEYATFQRTNLYDGNRHNAQLSVNRKGLNINAEGNLLTTKGLLESSRFFRPKLDISQNFKKIKDLKIGIYAEREQNERKAAQSDTLSRESFYYDLIRFYLEKPASEKASFGINYSKRFDYAPKKTTFQQNTDVQEWNITGMWKNKTRTNLTWNLTYRQLQILDSTTTTQKPQDNYIGRVDYNTSAYKGAIRSTTNYEIGSGQEQKIEYVFTEGQPGQGALYKWIDFNSDGVRQQSEYVVAPNIDEAKYIRVTVLTNQFIRTNNVQFNESFNLEPRLYWQQTKGVKKALSLFSTQSSYRVQRKVHAGTPNAWNPLRPQNKDSSLVSTTAAIRNVLYFNKSNPIYELQLGATDNANRAILTTGYESRRTTENFVHLRWNIGTKHSLQMHVANGLKNNASEINKERNYQIRGFSLEPQYSFQPQSKLRFSLNYKFSTQRDTINGTETALTNDFRLETTL
ncbi:MAG: hypothetical protein RLZZ292_1902, partial [Bacteroidota bacterium]